MHPLSWLAASLLCTAVAQLAFKAYARKPDRWLLAVTIGLFVLVSYANYNALRGLPLGTVYVATAVSQLLVVLLSLVMLGERYTPRQYIGFAVVLLGVVVYNS
jgi:drug/metabolite transporter (DMT)-like permease